MSSSWQQGKLKEFCKQKGIHLAAWSPLGSYTKSWGTNSVMESPIINEIATSRHKSVPQVLFLNSTPIFVFNYPLYFLL
ncbi:hypothetical protein HN51_028451 [Arachis hypogaea]